jgi:hypothetical protein
MLLNNKLISCGRETDQLLLQHGYYLTAIMETFDCPKQQNATKKQSSVIAYGICGLHGGKDVGIILSINVMWICR